MKNIFRAFVDAVFFTSLVLLAFSLVCLGVIAVKYYFGSIGLAVCGLSIFVAWLTKQIYDMEYKGN